MNEPIDRHQLLTAASKTAEKAFQAAHSDDFAHYPAQERELWATATIIHCDIVRFMVAFDDCTTEGIARLLWMGDVASKLHEARHWFYRTGTPILLKVAGAKGLDLAIVRDEVKAIKASHPLAGLDRYADYRNKVGHHYDHDLVAHLLDFSKMDAPPFFAALTSYAMFSAGWVRLCKSVIAHGPKA